MNTYSKKIFLFNLPVAVSTVELVSVEASGADAPELAEQPLDGPQV